MREDGERSGQKSGDEARAARSDSATLGTTNQCQSQSPLAKLLELAKKARGKGKHRERNVGTRLGLDIGFEKLQDFQTSLLPVFACLLRALTCSSCAFLNFTLLDGDRF